ncbi:MULTISPECIES: hypothetical protein [unclassified Streptomyces]|uniref:hypothetical protein n=1 Tax=unclassified Streptomyces TaxID=2593676 RepID=UPI002DDABD61|nr:hypothetical protein [Streptomyces sp. NBC_01750]WSB01606.1 hypothetical protein OIE54_21255 [Streptomyces sp. NBC_01794]WSD34067.1 hypothetical protein OG966_20525 [Streptomyces sp. NBC_01750]
MSFPLVSAARGGQDEYDVSELSTARFSILVYVLGPVIGGVSEKGEPQVNR